MNERIQELAEQVDACYIPRYDMWQMDSETMKKFAELIVQECFDVVLNDWRFGDSKSVIRYAHSRAKEHFGIEE